MISITTVLHPIKKGQANPMKIPWFDRCSMGTAPVPSASLVSREKFEGVVVHELEMG
jgi:hypothetical protein